MKYINCNSDEALPLLFNNNVFLTGPPGSGKSYLTNNYIKALKLDKIKVAITASTGIAAKIINGTTLHSWAGIGLAQNSKEKLLEDIKNNKYKKRNWNKTQVLIIDEISMISLELWSILNYIGKNIRKSQLPFGGIKILAVGDFFQLPPVKGQMLIEDNQTFESYFDYAIYLNQKFRSNDDNLNNILDCIRNGNKLSKEHNVLLKSKVDKENIKYPILVSLRDSARDMNIQKLNLLPSLEHKFQCDVYCINTKTGVKLNGSQYDSIKKIAFGECALENELTLKIDAPVIYLVNDPKLGLVNGSVGIIKEFRNSNPVVKFDLITIEIEKHSYKKEFNDVTVIVEQYPLLLAYSLTIHRAQGQTLSQGSILLDNTVWEEGQAYVALSRLRHLDNLTLLKYRKKVFKTSSKVREFYNKFTNQNNLVV
jgi:ATP-dependent exoDNAse (exonuclease V) alpha subunit